MKTIGLLGGTGWSSTINYYVALNQLVNKQLGGYHSAKIILKSIDYHDIMENYGKDHELTAKLLQTELLDLIKLRPECIIICCNSLHKYLDIIENSLNSSIPIMHAIKLTAQHCVENRYRNVLLLASKFTLNDGFFEKILTKHKLNVITPSDDICDNLHAIHLELLQGNVTENAKLYFQQLINNFPNIDAVILGCTEYSMAVDKNAFDLPIIDPVDIQTKIAVDFALDK